MKIRLHIIALMALAALVAGSMPALGAKPKGKGKGRAARTATVDLNEQLRKAREAFDAYDFATAATALDEYEEAPGKSDKEPTAEYKELRRLTNLGSTMIERVEKIVIIDSLTVDSAQFFNAYKLSGPSGFIGGNEMLPDGADASGNPTVYVSESNETMLWSQPAAYGGRTLVESHLLADGTWETPQSLGSVFENFDSPAYPFLMADGSTLYFAAKGDESLGGYDIFISRNNGEEYLQPQNMGMPYNSPYNDYMLAIDELTGAGWWATDRNRIDGKITIYVFVPQELRSNYPADTPDLARYAFVSDIARTADGKDYSGVLKAIKELDNETARESAEFKIAMPGGRIYTSMSDFHSPAAVSAMNEYLDARDELYDTESALEEEREKYRNGNGDSTTILQLEKNTEELRGRLHKLANKVARAEGAK